MAVQRQVIVLLEDERTGLRSARVGVVRRLLTRVRGAALDRRLAEGVAPESSLDLAIHADVLARPKQRAVLARDLDQIAVTARSTASKAQARLCRNRIREASAEFAALSHQLSAPGPVSVRGVAMIRVLVSDGTGPLFQRGTSSTCVFFSIPRWRRWTRPPREGQVRKPW
jgi:hypothetical protein